VRGSGARSVAGNANVPRGAAASQERAAERAFAPMQDDVAKTAVYARQEGRGRRREPEAQRNRVTNPARIRQPKPDLDGFKRGEVVVRSRGGDMRGAKGHRQCSQTACIKPAERTNQQTARR